MGTNDDPALDETYVPTSVRPYLDNRPKIIEN